MDYQCFPNYLPLFAPQNVQGRSAIEMEKWDLPTLFRRQYAHFVIHKLLWFHCKFSLVIQDDSTFIIVNS